jgi:hypothetical protein
MEGRWMAAAFTFFCISVAIVSSVDAYGKHQVEIAKINAEKCK